MKLRSTLVLTVVAAGGVLLAAERDPFPAPPPSASPVIAAGQRRHHLGPVEYFRGLLAMKPAERSRELAHKTPADRAAILAKLQEYEALPRDIREARLCQTELHWAMTCLMQLPPEQRAGPLKEVSPLYQPMIAQLLREWDQVPPGKQKALLENQAFIGVYLRLQGNPTGSQKEMIDTLPPARRAHWTEEMARWQALPAAQRTELCAQFQRFCLMSGDAREETAHALSPAERREMEETLRAFDQLPPEQRSVCINSFRKFATMAPDERAQFLENAARWDSMTLGERRLWRELVHRLPPMPPMPPSVLRNLPPMPPMPPNVTAPVIIARSPTASR